MTPQSQPGLFADRLNDLFVAVWELDNTQEDPMKKDEKLTKEKGQPVIKGVMEPEDLDIGETTNIDPPEEPLDKPKVYDVRTKTYVDIDIPK
jgi:hypothetical protein